MLLVHRSERADGLVAALAGVLRDPLPDPFAPEVVAVPAKGVERWVAQRLSHVLGRGPDGQDGVCANVVFMSPSRLVAEVVAAATPAGDADDDPWAPGPLTWTVLEAMADDAAARLPSTPARRLATAQHIASLYATYSSQRPRMLQAWAADDDVDGAGAALPPDIRWQADLWRGVRARIGRPSPAERLDDICVAVRSAPDAIDLPDRVSLFGPTRLATDELTVLAALAAHRDVHLWLPHASPVLWDRVAAMHPVPGRRRTDPTARAARHPLLASLSRDARELQVRLTGLDAEVRHEHHPITDLPDTLLGRLQQSVAADQPPPGLPLGTATDVHTPLDPQDRSLQVHACHGPARQVEVLRETLLGLLAADPTLEPRDVLVMCPDIEAYAPLISATFGLAEDESGEHPAHRLRVRLADRSLRQTNPLLGTLATLLELADGRMTASQVLDLAGSAPVRRRFQLDDDDLERLHDWVADAGVRWGLDADHRGIFKLDGLAQNTWRAGLDRVLTGVAMADDGVRWLGTALPLDDVDSSDIALAGRLGELVDRLTTALDGLTGEQSLTTWLTGLGDAVDLLTAVSDVDAWQLSQARHELADVSAAAGDRAESLVLTLADVRALLARRLQGRPTRANFRTGSLTMCSMVPMRSVPHRVVCLLGLDDGAFPREAGIDGDDVLARDPCVGERDRRSEDRQLLLDAVLAAQDHLVIVYAGADERTGALRTPAVPVGEILDIVDAMVSTPDGSPARSQVVVRHPLQPFDARNFSAGALGAPGPFSFDRPSLAGARASLQPRAPRSAFLPAPLPPPEEKGLALDDLIRVLEHPVRGFVRQRLGVSVLDEAEEVIDSLAVDLSPLAKWGVGERLLTARLNGADAVASREAELRRGTMPPGELGAPVLDQLLREIEPLVTAGEQARSAPVRTVDVVVQLSDGRSLTGTVGSIYGTSLVRVTYSRLGAKHRLRAWLQLLSLVLGCPGEPWQAVTIGRAKAPRPKTSTLEGMSTDSARDALNTVVALYDAALVEPVPMAVKTSAAYAERRHGGGSVPDAIVAADREWTGEFGEMHDRWHSLVWGPAPDIEVLTGADRPDGGAGEPTRFGELACDLWTPLLDAETTALA